MAEGIPNTASAPAPSDLFEHLKEGWQFIGEVNKMRAYSRSRQAVCVANWRNFGEAKESLRVFCRSTHQRRFECHRGGFEVELGLTTSNEWDAINASLPRV